MSQIFDKDLPKNNEVFYEGDPHLYFHEFQFVLGRIALETIGKGLDKKDDDKTLIKFFKEHLLIRSDQEFKQGKPLPEINRPFMRRLTQAYQSTNKGRKTSIGKSHANTSAHTGIEEAKENYEDDYEEGEDEEAYDPNEYDDHNEEIVFSLEPLNLDLADIYKKLDKELPKIPDEILMYYFIACSSLTFVL